MAWTNADGLPIRYFREEGETADFGRVPAADGTRNVIEWDLVSTKLNGTTGTQYGTPATVAVPVGATIVRAFVVVDTPFVSGGSSTLDIGLQRKDGTEIDNDGIFAALAKSSLDTIGERTEGTGALVVATGGGKLAYNGYLYVKANSAAFTAGKARLIVEYVLPLAAK